jgi:hypothetical protein
MQTSLRKIFFLLLIAQGSWLAAFPQYWQQQVNYRIDVSLDDRQHTLTGFAKMEYTNNSPDTLRFIWFHLWPNAYKNDKTAFSDQLLENGNTKFYFSNKEEKGYINRLDFRVDNSTAELEDHPQHIDIAKLVLPSPLAPGKRITITTPFHVKLPYNFSRGGHDGQSYQATQWYPKPAVYDQKGWHAMPYLDQGEFYSEFGNFEVHITVPKNYVVAATGELQDAAEKEWLTTRKSFTWEPIRHKEKIKGGGFKTTVQLFPESSNETKTLRYLQQNVHDFAWFADKRFIVDQDSMSLPSGRVIQVYSYYTPAQKEQWSKTVQYTKQATRFYSASVGEYPYPVVSVVQGPESFGGGMEYPTITIISPTDDDKQLDKTIAHEIGHNWFYGILASNERKHPWMDEGINSFYETRYAHNNDPNFVDTGTLQLLQTFIAEKKDQPIATSSEDFGTLNYALVAYYKASRWAAWLEKEFGRETFDKAMKTYYDRWQFKHPQPEDFKKVMEEVSGRNLDSAFALLYVKGELPGTKRKGVGFRGPIGAARGKHTDKREAITFHPMGGFNSYDKLMLGVTLTNLRLPPNRIQFWVTPMYGIGSKTFTGIGFVNYTMNPDGLFSKIDIGVNGATFSADRFTDENNKKTFLGFQKIAPGIRFTFKEKSARSTFYRFIQFKSFFISEDGLRFWRDTVFTPTDTIIVNNYGKGKESRTLQQLKFVIENNRALYPYRGELKIEQGEDFVRTGFTGNYFFNYPKEGGLNVRLFGGKFFYTSSKTINKEFATDRYHLNMTGPNGYEDYTYSDYFVGRNHFQGLASQQIMLRDGAFKVRTDLLADKVGRTDDWLIAANFTSHIPDAINPLSILPIKIPLKVFVDIGTYSEAWKPGAGGDRFLYDAGLQVSLLKETVHIYLPLLYSRVFKDYIQSTVEKKGRLWKTVSFTIDISNFSFRKLDRNFDF